MTGLEDLIVGTLPMTSLQILKKLEQEFEDGFIDIKELIRDYETPEDVGVREFSSFVYGYSMTVELIHNH
jgi:hypothetical protein